MINKETRGAKKGENRFKSSQANNIKHKLDLIDKCLHLLNKSKVRFNSTTALAKHVSDIINEGHLLKRPLSHVTLLRNNEYRIKLESYQLTYLRTSNKNKVSSLAYEIEVKELKKELAILRKHAEKHSLNINIKKIPAPCNCEQKDVEQLCKLIDAIIEATDGSITIDSDSKTFIKSWLKSDNRYIGTKNMALPYFNNLINRVVNK